MDGIVSPQNLCTSELSTFGERGFQKVTKLKGATNAGPNSV
jgi:hypothetical protein